MTPSTTDPVAWAEHNARQALVPLLEKRARMCFSHCVSSQSEYSLCMTTRQLRQALKINALVKVGGYCADLLDVGKEFSKIRFIGDGQICDRPNDQIKSCILQRTGSNV